MKNRLQLRHCDTLFTNKAEAIEHIKDYAEIKGPGLFAEPIVLKYGDVDEPNILLAIGSVGDGSASRDNRYFIIDYAQLESDIADLQKLLGDEIVDSDELKAALEAEIERSTSEDKKHDEAISANSNAISEEIKRSTEADETHDAAILNNTTDIANLKSQVTQNKVAVIDSTSIKLTETVSETGTLIKGDLILSNAHDNQLTILDEETGHNGGLYYHVSINYDSDRGKLQLLVNGEISHETDLLIDQLLKDVQYDSHTKILTFTFVTISDTGEREDKVVEVNIDDLVDTYVAGNGISIDKNRDGNYDVSVKLDQTIGADTFLTVGANGIRLSGVQDAIDGAKQSAIDNVRGTSADTSDNVTVYGAKKLSQEILGVNGDTSNKITVYGVKKYAEEVLGTDADASSAKTVYGSIALANEKHDELLGGTSDDSSKFTIYGTRKLINEKTSDLQNAIGSCETNLSSLKQDFETKLSAETTARETADNTEKNARESADNALGVRIDTTNNNVSANTESINLLNSSVNTNSSDIEVLKENISEEKAAIAELKTRDSELDAKINSHIETATNTYATKEALKQVQDNVDKAVIDIGTNTSGITSLSSKVSSIETKINALDNKDAEIVSAYQAADNDIKERVSKLEDKNLPYYLNQVNGDSLTIGLYDSEGNLLGDAFSIPKISLLEKVEYDHVDKKIIFTFKTDTGNTVTEIDVSDLVDTYNAGEGVLIDAGNNVSVKVASGEKYLKVDSNGLATQEIDNAISNAIDVSKTNIKSELIGSDSDLSNADTIWAAKKYTQEKVSELQGTSADISSIPTVYGVKKYAEEVSSLTPEKQANELITVTIEQKNNGRMIHAQLEAVSTPMDLPSAQEASSYTLLRTVEQNGKTMLLASNRSDDILYPVSGATGTINTPLTSIIDNLINELNEAKQAIEELKSKVDTLESGITNTVKEEVALQLQDPLVISGITASVSPVVTSNVKNDVINGNVFKSGDDIIDVNVTDGESISISMSDDAVIFPENEVE